MALPSSAKSSQPIRVALLCEHPAVYRSLSSRLSADPAFQVIEAIDCQIDNVPAVMTEKPDVVILGISHITHFNMLVSQAVHQADAHTRIMVLSSYEADPVELQMARESGADAIVLKSIDTPALVDKIHTLVEPSV